VTAKSAVGRTSLDDVGGVVEVYCSSVREWFKRVGGRRVRARYEDLTVSGLWGHGVLG